MDIPGSTQVNAVHFLNSTTGFAACGFGYIFKTTNGGINWQFGEAGSYWLNDITFVDQQTGYMVSENGIIYKTTNSGAGWNVEPQLCANGLTEIEAVNSSTIYAGGYYGSMLRYGTSLTPVSGNNGEIPSSYKLEQNYPNPFNPATTIKFNIPQNGMVKLSVYDITGREISNPVNSRMNAGSYEVSFNAANLSSGVYFYRIDAAGSEGLSFTETKKMILVK
jgi:hypothetical protein